MAGIHENAISRIPSEHQASLYFEYFHYLAKIHTPDIKLQRQNLNKFLQRILDEKIPLTESRAFNIMLMGRARSIVDVQGVHLLIKVARATDLQPLTDSERKLVKNALRYIIPVIKESSIDQAERTRLLQEVDQLIPDRFK